MYFVLLNGKRETTPLCYTTTGDTCIDACDQYACYIAALQSKDEAETEKYFAETIADRNIATTGICVRIDWDFDEVKSDLYSLFYKVDIYLNGELQDSIYAVERDYPLPEDFKPVYMVSERTGTGELGSEIHIFRTDAEAYHWCEEFVTLMYDDVDTYDILYREAPTSEIGGPNHRWAVECKTPTKVEGFFISADIMRNVTETVLQVHIVMKWVVEAAKDKDDLLSFVINNCEPIPEPPLDPNPEFDPCPGTAAGSNSPPPH